MHAPNLKMELLVAREAAQKAASFIASSVNKSQLIEEKGLGDLVSDVDRKAESLIITHIATHFPNDNFLAEESGLQSKSRNGRLWIIDPLDATSAFLFKAGNNLPSVMIALQIDEEISLGVLFFPLTDELFWAIRGNGAYYNGKKVMITHHRPLAECWIDINQYSDQQYESDRVKILRDRLRGKNGARLVTSLVPHSGIAARIILHEPEIDAVIHDNNPKRIKQQIWDVAAPSLIVAEAGGCIVNLEGSPYDMRNPAPFAICSTRALADEIMSL